MKIVYWQQTQCTFQGLKVKIKDFWSSFKILEFLNLIQNSRHFSILKVCTLFPHFHQYFFTRDFTLVSQVKYISSINNTVMSARVPWLASLSFVHCSLQREFLAPSHITLSLRFLWLSHICVAAQFVYNNTCTQSNDTVYRWYSTDSCMSVTYSSMYMRGCVCIWSFFFTTNAKRKRCTQSCSTTY